MSLAIQGSFEAYIWAALWQVTLGALQAGGPLFNPRAEGSNWIARLQQAVSLMGSAISWAACCLGVWVAIHESVSAGLLFFGFSIAVNVLTLLEIRSFSQHATIAQFLAFLVMPIFAFMTLNTVGLLDYQQ